MSLIIRCKGVLLQYTRMGTANCLGVGVPQVIAFVGSVRERGLDILLDSGTNHHTPLSMCCLSFEREGSYGRVLNMILKLTHSWS
jgi:hypothetical protein